MTATIMIVVEKMALLSACLFLMLVAWEDFRKFRIRNISVLTLLGIYVVFALARGDAPRVLTDLSAGLLLFVIGFVFWLGKLMGAGDAKLFFAVGCWVGLQGLTGWAILLILFSVVLWLLVRVPFPVYLRHLAVVDRLDELRRGRKVPYAVPISFAALTLLLPTVFL